MGGVSVGRVNDTRNSQKSLENVLTFRDFSRALLIRVIVAVDVTYRTSDFILVVNFHTAM